MWAASDLSGIDVDVFLANAVPTGGSKMAPVTTRGRYVPKPPAVVLGLDPSATDVPAGLDVFTGSAGEDWQLVESLLTAGLVRRLLELDRPVRFLAASWTNAAVELVERLEAEGVVFDRSLVPSILGGSVQYWSSKIGATELLRSVLEVSAHVPATTMVSSLAEAAMVTSSFSGPCVLKVNRGVGGAGIIGLDRRTQVDELEPRLRTTVRRKMSDGKWKAKGDILLSGPYVLQQFVGGPGNVSPSLDFLVGPDYVVCIGIAEQLLDGFRYLGARFPGRLDKRLTATCARLGCAVGRHLGAAGYRGLLNVDFVVDGDDIWVVEINVRQSAPLDQSLRATTCWGPGWRAVHGFEFYESDGELKLW